MTPFARSLNRYNAEFPTSWISTFLLRKEWSSFHLYKNFASPIADAAASAIGDAKFLYKWNEDHSFLKRNVDIHDVGNSALYLLSDLANGVTGEIHYVDAGYNKVGMPDPKNIT